MAERADSTLGAIAPDVATGLRAAAATLLPLYLASSLGRPALAWAALGGWLGTLADPGGARRSRARQLAAFALAGAACVALTGLAGRDVRAAVPALAAIAFACSLLRALGAAGASLGTMLTITSAIGLSRGGPSPADDALHFAAGAAWATLLSTAVWPVWTHLPVRRELAKVFGELASYAAAVDACAALGARPDDPRWAELAGRHRRRIREAVEAARAMALAVRARRPGEGRVGSNLRVLLGLAESQFALLVALAEAIGAGPAGAPTSRLREALRATSRRADEVRRRLLVAAIVRAPRRGAEGEHEREREHEREHERECERTSAVPAGRPGGGRGAAGGPPTDAAAPSLRPADVPSPRPTDAPAPSLRPADALAERMRRASALSLEVASDLDAPTESTEGDPAPPGGRSPRDAARVLVAALSLRSSIFRHALRVACAAAAALLVGHRLSPAHTHWVTVTTLTILQPYPGASRTRAAERIAGTLFGSLVAVALTTFVRSPAWLAALMVPLSVAALATRPHSYRLFTFFLTPVFVLLAERYPGDWWTAAARVGDTVAGGAVALAAAFLVFPAWEARRLPETLAAMFAAVRRYAGAVLGGLADGALARDEARALAARRDAGVALGEAETALERALDEPARAGRAAADAMQLVTFARRLAGSLTALELYALEDARRAEAAEAGAPAAGPPAGARGVSGEVARAIAAYVDDVLRDAEAFSRGEPAVPPPAPPPPPGGLDAHARGLAERVVNLAALTAGLLAARAGEAPPQAASG